jgi:hypothetical protein
VGGRGCEDPGRRRHDHRADNARGDDPELERQAQQERLGLDGYKKAMGEAADAIRDQMRAELEGRTAPGTSLEVPRWRIVSRRRS